MEDKKELGNDAENLEAKKMSLLSGLEFLMDRYFKKKWKKPRDAIGSNR